MTRPTVRRTERREPDASVEAGPGGLAVRSAYLSSADTGSLILQTKHMTAYRTTRVPHPRHWYSGFNVPV